MIRIYGFGNALIDVEITVSDKELASVGIAKGSMVHIGYNQKNLWLKQFRRKIASRQPGGSIANSIYAASNEDTFCSFSCSLGKYEEGKKVKVPWWTMLLSFLKMFLNPLALAKKLMGLPIG